MQIVRWLIWGMLLTGSSLMSVGLWKEARRFFQWKRMRADYEGEIVPCDNLLKTGLEIRLNEENRGESGTGFLRALLKEIHKNTLTLAVEDPFFPGNWREEELERLPLTELGAALVVSFAAADAVYRFTTVVRDAQSAPGRPVASKLIVSRPTWVARVQRRQHYRTPLNLPATFEMTTVPNSPQTDDEPDNVLHLPLHATVVNLSGGGLCAELEGWGDDSEKLWWQDAIAPGSVLRLRIPVPALSTSQLHVRVRDCQKIVVRGGLKLRAACEFLPLAHWEQEHLIQFVFRAQHERLKARFQPPQQADASSS